MAWARVETRVAVAEGPAAASGKGVIGYRGYEGEDGCDQGEEAFMLEGSQFV
jgi:hypothetical protein